MSLTAELVGQRPQRFASVLTLPPTLVATGTTSRRTATTSPASPHRPSPTTRPSSYSPVDRMPSWATAGERCGLLWLTSIQRMTWSSAWRQVRMHERAGDAATSEGVGRRFWRANRRRSVRILLRARPGCCRLAPFLACSQFLRAGATRRGRGAGCSSGSGARRRCAGTARRAMARSYRKPEDHANETFLWTNPIVDLLSPAGRVDPEAEADAPAPRGAPLIGL